MGRSDGNGQAPSLLKFTTPPQRVVSLVPSMTESLCELGLGQALVGITDYCLYPAEALARLPRLGGPKNPDLQAILDLQPDLVIANMEENSRQAVEALEAQGVAVWVTFPRTVRQSMELLWKLVELFHDHGAGMRVEMLEVTLDWALTALAETKPLRYFCPIWRERSGPPGGERTWWMTFNQETYCSDLLRILGAKTSSPGASGATRWMRTWRTPAVKRRASATCATRAWRLTKSSPPGPRS